MTTTTTKRKPRRTVVAKIVLTEAELQTMMDQAARRALESVGLHDETAGKDVRDLRSLIDGWRGVKKTAMRSVVQTATVALLGLLLLGASVKFWRAN